MGYVPLTFIFLCAIVNCTLGQSMLQPVIGYRTVSILTQKGLQFKDLNAHSDHA